VFIPYFLIFLNLDQASFLFFTRHYRLLLHLVNLKIGKNANFSGQTKRRCFTIFFAFKKFSFYLDCSYASCRFLWKTWWRLCKIWLCSWCLSVSQCFYWCCKYFACSCNNWGFNLQIPIFWCLLFLFLHFIFYFIVLIISYFDFRLIKMGFAF